MIFALPGPEGSGPETGHRACRIRVWTHPRGSADSRGRQRTSVPRARARSAGPGRRGGPGARSRSRTVSALDKPGAWLGRGLRISPGAPRALQLEGPGAQHTPASPASLRSRRWSLRAGSCSLPSRAASAATSGPRALLQKWLPDADSSCVDLGETRGHPW